MRYFRAFVIPLLALACSSKSQGMEQPPPDDTSVSVEIGVPSGSDGLAFAPLAAGSELRLQSFGQGGTHVLLGVRTTGFGNRAYTRLSLTNLTTGVVVASPAPARPQLYACADDGTCDLVPILAMASGLTGPDEERNGLVIEIGADVSNDLGLHATATQQAVLSTADL